jgi:hypothetical protein
MKTYTMLSEILSTNFLQVSRGLSIRGRTRYFYSHKMVFGTS